MAVIHVAQGSTFCTYTLHNDRVNFVFQAMSQKSSDQVGSLKEEHQKELAKVKEEVDTLKASLEAKTKEVNDKNTTLLQARQLKILRIIKILA